MSQQSHTPESVPIKARNREHQIDEGLSRDWFGGHPFKTAWFNSMSITFPLGEKFFIDSVRHFADQITDPKLKQEIAGFCGQENVHRREHERYNKSLCAQRGYDLSYLEGRIAKKMALTHKMFSPIQKLAITVALEHITAIMAEWSLDKNSTAAQEIEPAMRELWDWHAAEEMEHKAVAFDVYKAVGGTEKMRKSSLRRASFFLTIDILIGLMHMLKKDKKLWQLSLWRDGWTFLLGKRGIMRLIWPSWKEFMVDGFHPWQRDTQGILKEWQQGDLSTQP